MQCAMKLKHHPGLLLVAVITALFLSCHAPAARPNTGDQGATLVVENQGFNDMNVYVVPSAGGRVRIGTAIGNTTSKLKIPPYLLRGPTELAFRCEPIGGQRAPTSDRITVTPGDEVTLTIPPS